MTPFKRLSDLQFGDEKATLNHLVEVCKLHDFSVNVVFRRCANDHLTDGTSSILRHVLFDVCAIFQDMIVAASRSSWGQMPRQVMASHVIRLVR